MSRELPELASTAKLLMECDALGALGEASQYLPGVAYARLHSAIYTLAEEAVRLLAKVDVHRDYSAGFETRCKRLLVKARCANPLDGQIIMARDLEQLAEIAIRARSQEGDGAIK